MPLPGISSIFYYLPFDVMQAHAKSLNERFRTLISLIFGLAIGCSLLFGESRWETSPLIEESLMLLACFMAGIGAFGRIWCSLYIAGYKNNVLVTDGPYSMCRNPLYFFSFVGGIGVSCATETFTIPPAYGAGVRNLLPVRHQKGTGKAPHPFRRRLPELLQERSLLHSLPLTAQTAAGRLLRQSRHVHAQHCGCAVVHLVHRHL